MSLSQVVNRRRGFVTASNMPLLVLDLAYTHQQIMVRYVRSPTYKHHDCSPPLVDSLTNWFNRLLPPRPLLPPNLDRAER